MKPLYKQPLIEAAILASGIMCTVLLIHGVQNFIAMGGKPATSQIAEKSNPDLVQVAAAPNCPYSASVSMGQTAVASEMREWPAKNMKIYNPFPNEYKNTLSGTKPPGTALAAGQKDTKLPIIGTIFGYKPSTANYYLVQENDGKPVQTEWTAYLLGIPTSAGDPIKAPQTGYDIGGGKMGLVVYATTDQITIHVGRHEYLSGGNSTESGGYWIYLKGLCVNDQIVAQYNANATSRKQLPELAKGELLGYAQGAQVLVAVRDNGPFTDILAPEWWTGVPAKTVAPPGGDPDPGGGGAKVGLGLACTTSSDCLSGACAPKSPPTDMTMICKQGTLTPGATCTDPSQCASNICSAETGKCLAQAPGTYTVSGTITVTGAGMGSNYVMVFLSNTGSGKTTSTSPTRSANYSITGLENGKYIITATLLKDDHYDKGDIIGSTYPVEIEIKSDNLTKNFTIVPDASAATTSTVSGTITLAGGIGTNKVRVQIFSDTAPPVQKYQNDPSTNLTYSIPGVINGTYQIHADLINGADTITSSSPDRAFVVNGSDIKDLDLSIPAPAAAPPAAGLPDWVKDKLFCIDTSKQDSCKSEGIKIDNFLYCGTNNIDSRILPYVKLFSPPGYKEDCNYGGIPYLGGKRSITITEGGVTSFDGVNYCVYTAINLQGKSAVCEGSSYSCRDICDFKNSPDPTTPVTFNIHVRNATGLSDDRLIVESVAFKKDDQAYPTTKSSNLEYSVDIPFNKVIINSMYSSNEITIKFHTKATTGDSRTYTETGYLSLPVDKPEFAISLDGL